jgi:ABC-type uncharacterized transport system YnjBCD permease subunit
MKREVHPVWRGVGFVLIIVIPIISILAAIVLVNANKVNHWIRVPRELLVNFSDPYIIVKAILAFLIGFLLFIILTIITFIANRFWGPPRYGPYDVPVESYIPKKK